MRFTCDQQDFLKALTVSQKAISSNPTLPILSNVLLKAEGQKLILTSTNLEVSIQINIPIDLKNEGSITIPSRVITNWVNFCKQGEIEVKIEEGDSVSLKTSDAKTKIKGVSADDFPIIPKIEKENEFFISIKDLKDAINEVSFSCSHSNIRPVLSGVLMQNKKDIIHLVATDSYRLSERRIKLKEKIENDIYIIIPSKTMIELERVLSGVKDKEKEVKIITSQNQILFQIDNIEIISRLIEGKFPEYNQIIPKTEKSIIEINKEDFILSIKRVGIFARENNNNIKLNFEGDKVLITTNNTEIGTEESEVEIKLSGSNNQTALNSLFLLDVLNIIPDKEIIIKIAEKLSPVVIHGKNQKEFIHVIMPLKV
ncbi:MAG: DNA polymerase III subunit beta [Candidatus Gracilibacteria bacterium]|jgi:DNA polymerase-3 subunit beta|nr:DNA polymerase III subunit beta [Candidatus Gracilibacteria bacterium]